LPVAEVTFTSDVPSQKLLSSTIPHIRSYAHQQPTISKVKFTNDVSHLPTIPHLRSYTNQHSISEVNFAFDCLISKATFPYNPSASKLPSPTSPHPSEVKCTNDVPFQNYIF
jgi:hypothetical protein